MSLVFWFIAALLTTGALHFVTHRICRVDFRPSEFVAQVNVEQVAIGWLTRPNLAEVRRDILRLLDHASRRTRNATFRKRLAKIRQTIDEAGFPVADIDYKAIGGALRDTLRWHAALTPRPRSVPFNWWQQALYRNRIIEFFLVVCMAAVLWQLSFATFPSRGSEYLEPAVRFLAILILTHALAFSATMVLATVLLYRSHAKFRSLLITSRPISDPLVRKAITTLAKHGKLTAYFLDQPQPRHWPDLELMTIGSDLIFAESGFAPTILYSLVDHSDFIILDQDCLIAAQALPLLNHLPVSRRCLLTDDGGPVRDGYTALSRADLADGAMSRRFIWADQEGATPDYQHTAHSYAAPKLIYTFSSTAVIAGVALLFFPALWLFGAYVLSCGVLGLFPSVLGPHRRYQRHSEWLGTPRNIRASDLLTYYRGWTQWVFAGGYAVGLFLIWSVFDNPFGDDRIASSVGIGLIIFFAGSLWMLNGFPGLLRALKWYLDWNFRIVILHRNVPAASHLHKSVVMPLCGAYGQVVMISEKDLAALDIKGGEKFAHEVLSEHYNTIRCDDHLEEWQDHFAREIMRADCAVFDWRIDVTPTMIWELEQSLQTLPATRIMVLCDSETEPRVHEVIQDKCKADAHVVFTLSLPRDERRAEKALRSALRKLMSELKPERRLAKPALVAPTLA